MKSKICKNENLTKGQTAENKVADYLENLGYKIDKRNFYLYMIGEIDIIASKKDTIFFVEVKYRSNKNTYDIPDGCISYKKMKKIRRCADMYLQRNNITDKYCKFIGALVHFMDEDLIPQIKLISFE